MRKKFIFLTILFGLLFTFLFIANLLFKSGFLLSFTITMGVFAYHFVMRLLVGLFVDKIFNNNISYNKKWFKTCRFEEKIDRFLKVKRWKKYIPSYNPATFSLKNTYSQIASATCQAELVHEIIIVLSFVPILLSIWFGTTAVFVITSVLAALIDLIFVILQRYNRPRILKIKIKKENRE